MKTLFAALAMLCATTALLAQKTFQGTLDYEYSVQGEQAEMVKPMLPSNMQIAYGDGAAMTTMEGGQAAAAFRKIIIFENKGLLVNDAQKTVFEVNESEIQAMNKRAKAVSPKIEKVAGQTKEILGYECQQYKVILPNQPSPQMIWVAEDLKAPENVGPTMGAISQSAIGNASINGLPLQIEQDLPQVSATMTISATDIDDSAPADAAFEAPADYDVKPIAEYRAQGQQGGNR